MLAHLIVGLFNVLLGIGIVIGSVALGVTWLGICFGTVILGIVLLIFAPAILLFPFGFVAVGLGFVWVGFEQLGEVLEDEKAVTLSPKAPPRPSPDPTDEKITKIVQQLSTPEYEKVNKRFDETSKFDIERGNQAEERHQSSPSAKVTPKDEPLDMNDRAAQALKRIEDMANVAKQDVASHIDKKARTKRWIFNMKDRCLIDTQFNKTYWPGEFLHVSGERAGFKVQSGSQLWVSDADVFYQYSGNAS